MLVRLSGRSSLPGTWNRSEHINVLELRTLLTEIKHRCRSMKTVSQKYVVLTDSAACIGVVAKHRSSSRKLNSVIKRINALSLVSGTVMLTLHVRSEHNPADRGSRRLRVKLKSAHWSPAHGSCCEV